MRAAVAISQSDTDPLSGLVLQDEPEPEPREGWSIVRVSHTSLNMHDLWTLRGVGHPAERLPMILGCDVAGWDEHGNRVLVYPIIADTDAGNGDETLDPNRALLSEQHNGSFAEYISVPDRCLIPIPDWLTMEQAACLPVAWGTAYRMLFTQARVRPGDRVLVQGVGGGVASAAIALAAAAGAHVYATTRDLEKGQIARQWGALDVLEIGGRLPERADLVIETVGEATWSHSLKSLRPGGTVVVSGATSGMHPSADLGRIFYLQQKVLGSTGCTRPELQQLLRVMEATGVRPHIDRRFTLESIHDAFQIMIDGTQTGKLVIDVAGEDS